MKVNTTRAAVLVESRKPLIVDEITLPETLGVGQVLVRVLHSTICGAQLNEIAAAKGPDKFLPHLLGHEASAEVLETGPGVTEQAGDVVSALRPGLGIQSPTPTYGWRGARLNAGWITTFNQYAVISENRTADPEGFRPEDRAASRLRGDHGRRRHQQRRQREDRRVGRGLRCRRGRA